jgi:hypothetical protein
MSDQVDLNPIRLDSGKKKLNPYVTHLSSDHVGSDRVQIWSDWVNN